MEVPTLRRSSFPEDYAPTNFSLFSESSVEVVRDKGCDLAVKCEDSPSRHNYKIHFQAP